MDLLNCRCREVDVLLEPPESVKMAELRDCCIIEDCLVTNDGDESTHVLLNTIMKDTHTIKHVKRIILT